VGKEVSMQISRKLVYYIAGIGTTDALVKTLKISLN
jgi:hypothetical protein